MWTVVRRSWTRTCHWSYKASPRRERHARPSPAPDLLHPSARRLQQSIKQPARNRGPHQGCTAGELEPEWIGAAPRQHDERINQQECQDRSRVLHRMPASDRGRGQASQESRKDRDQRPGCLNTQRRAQVNDSPQWLKPSGGACDDDDVSEEGARNTAQPCWELCAHLNLLAWG